MTEFIGTLRCQSCGKQIGLRDTRLKRSNPTVVIPRCYACAAAEEAERILREQP